MSSKNAAENLKQCIIRNDSFHSTDQPWNVATTQSNSLKIGVNTACADSSDSLKVTSTAGYTLPNKNSVSDYPFSLQSSVESSLPSWQILRLQKVSTPTPTANVSWISEPLSSAEDGKTANSGNPQCRRSASVDCRDSPVNRRKNFPEKCVSNFPTSNDSITPQSLWNSRLPQTSNLSSEQQLVLGAIRSNSAPQAAPVSVACAPNKYLSSGNRLLTIASAGRSFDASQSGNIFVSSVQPSLMWSPVVNREVLAQFAEGASPSAQVDSFRNSQVREQGELSPNVSLLQNLSAHTANGVHQPHSPVVSGACSTDINPGNGATSSTMSSNGSHPASSVCDLPIRSKIVLVTSSAGSRQNSQVDDGGPSEKNIVTVPSQGASFPSSIRISQVCLGAKRQTHSRKQKNDKSVDADAEAPASSKSGNDEALLDNEAEARVASCGGEEQSACLAGNKSNSQNASPITVAPMSEGGAKGSSLGEGQDGSPPPLKVVEGVEKGKGDTGSNSSSTDESCFMNSVNYGPSEKSNPMTYACHLCGFTNDSKFHFNSHMNTHADHKCDICDYRSRTEGRLKRHRIQFHEDRSGTGTENAVDGNGLEVSQSNTANRVYVKVENSEVEDQLQQCMMNSGFKQEGASPDETLKDKSFAAGARNKTYRCKQCFYIAQSKNEFWIHQRSHIKTDKQLACPKCPFVTEYKHHLEYHLRNHFNSKPFKCSKCNYSCVNKSMLNSHMKSHSNFYQYRCADCTYATKYCHSLKLHLRKYGHSAAAVMNPDGSVLDASAIDVYGNRRGPRGKKIGYNNATPSTPPTLNPVAAIAASSADSVVSQYTLPMHPLVKAIQQQQSGLFGDSKGDLDSATAAAAVGLSHLSSGGQLPTMIAFPSALPSLAQKCTWCDYMAPSQEMLLKHIAVHFSDNKDMMRLFSYANGGGYVDSAESAAAAALMDMPSFGLSTSELGVRGSDAGGASARSSNTSVECGDAEVSLRRPALTSTPSGLSGTCSGSECGGKVSGDSFVTAGATETIPGQWSSVAVSRRKRKAIKVDRIADKLQCRLLPSKRATGATTYGVKMEMTEQCQEEQLKSDFMKCSEAAAQSSSFDVAPVTTSNSFKFAIHPQSQGQFDWSGAYVCSYCMIAFKDLAMYNIHMGYHAYSEPFKCNMCGHVCEDRLSMFIHIARDSHK